MNTSTTAGNEGSSLKTSVNPDDTADSIDEGKENHEVGFGTVRATAAVFSSCCHQRSFGTCVMISVVVDR